MREAGRDIFEHAQAYMLATMTLYDKCLGQDFPYSMILVPAQASAAFTCELFLKARLQIAGKPSKGHDLWKLFKRLPDEAKEDIERRWNEQFSLEDLATFTVGRVRYDFETVVRASAHHFTHLRYWHEAGDRLWAEDYAGKILQVRPLMSILEMHIVSLKPDWTQHRNMPDGFRLEDVTMKPETDDLTSPAFSPKPIGFEGNKSSVQIFPSAEILRKARSKD